METRTEYNDTFRDFLYRSARRKENILEMVLREGGIDALKEIMQVDAQTCDDEAFYRSLNKARLVLQSVKELSVALPTTSYSNIQSETTHNYKTKEELPQPRFISDEELMKANLLYLENKKEEKEFKEEINKKQEESVVIDI